MRDNEALKLFLLSAVLLASPQAGSAQGLVFETATLGPVGQPATGPSILEEQFLGAKFEVVETAEVRSVGGHVAGSSLSPDIFVAVVPLDPVTDLPATFDLSDAVFSAVFDVPTPSNQVVIQTDFQLDPGRYGILFGSGLFGATGFGVMPANDFDVGNPEYFFSDNTVPVYTNGGFNNARFFVNVVVFADGFESGDTSAWTSAVGD